MSSSADCGLHSSSCARLSDSDGPDYGGEAPTGAPVDSVGIVKSSHPESVEEQLPDDGFNVTDEKEIFHTPPEFRSTPTPNDDPIIGKPDENGSNPGVVEEENKRKRASSSSADQRVEGDEKANEGTEGTESESSSSKSGGGVGHNKEVELDKSNSPSPADVNAGDDDRADEFVGNQRDLDGSRKKARMLTIINVLRQLAANCEEDMSLHSKSLLEVAQEKWGLFPSV
ncbi:hypothetical protein V6N13_122480 [Hibiscus sabdariffa]|uniref:Uncharacterized protein n=1 Tax=Hibiscus sabdariffa TaxID=183260 RepID=A0ABR2Q770_9ROSI